MVQTVSNFCGDNHEASSSHYILDSIQNTSRYNIGHVGITPSVGLNNPQECINVSSYLSNRGNILTKCVPPKSNFDIHCNNNNNNNVKFNIKGMNNSYDNNIKENFSNVSKINSETFLLPEYTRRKGASKDISHVNLQAGFSGNPNNLHTEPQNLTYVIERMWLERGGLNSNQLIKDTWNLATVNNPNGPINVNNVEQMPTNMKLRRPYPIDAPFGLKFGQEQKQYNSIDVASTGVSTPLLDNPNNLPFNYSALYNNGGCNKISQVKNNMCNNNNNDLTGNESWNTLPPQGI